MNHEGRTTPLVLVADDDPILLKLATSALTANGYHVVSAPDGRQALELYHHIYPDAVVVDLIMPEMDGLAVCRAIRALPGGDVVPVLMMTAHDDRTSIESAFAAGATQFICKPVPWPVLGHHLRYMLRTRDAFTALKRSETENRLLSGQLEGLLDAVDDAVIIHNADTTIAWANRAASAIFSAGGSLRPGEPCPLATQQGDDCAVATSFATGTAVRREYTCADGTREIRTYPVADDTGTVTAVIEFVADITDKLAHQAETIRAGQLAALGELAAGVAHEINNPINGIINYAQLLVNRLDGNTREKEIAARIISEGDRVAGIVRGLLSFARERQEGRLPSLLADIVADSLALTEAQMRKDGIAIGIDLPPDLPRVVCDPQQIQQVVLNVLSNARYALNRRYVAGEAGKALAVGGETVERGGKRYVRLVVHDQGTGIRAADIDKVMNPFFTTKGGEGTGLGLSISRNIVENHGGRLRVQSVEGDHTRVTIDLPAELS